MDIKLTKNMDILQHNLPLIRKVAGWTQADLAGKLGFSRQMVANIEGDRNRLTVVHYYAIRWHVEDEITRLDNLDDINRYGETMMNLDIMLFHKVKSENTRYEIIFEK